MPIEAELKAVVREPEAVLKRLEDAYGPGHVEVYHDTYYDDPAGTLMSADRELRLRTVHNDTSTRTVLTYKSQRVDEASGSKPEFETTVDDAAAAHSIFRGLGYVQRISFEKRCRNYSFCHAGRSMLATLVRVPEIEGTFLEVETDATTEPALVEALTAVRQVLAGLGIEDGDLTTELYTDAVAAAR